MKYLKFFIHDYKGIDSASISLEPEGARVYTLIGLNESGKTTILEAIANFGVNDERTEVLFSELDQPSTRLRYIPKHKKSNFTGDIKINAMVKFDPGEKEAMLREIDKENNCVFKRSSIPDIIVYTRKYTYKDSEFVELGNFITINAVANDGVYKDAAVRVGHRLWGPLTSAIRKRFPRIIYFPTFLFAFPDRILLNPGSAEEPINAIYRKVIEDVAGALQNPIDVQRHIVDRMLATKVGSGAISFPDSDKQQAVFSVLEQMSYHLSQTIFSEWQQVLGQEYKKREVVLRPLVEQVDGSAKVYLQFALREEGAIFEISERSLGFRWFFSFLLFTHYRARGNLRGPTLFLLDEPASNLHPKAQMQLLRSFPKIASTKNAIIYTTHSHYMVNPRWLEQGFVVSNKANEDTDGDILDALVASPPHINVQKYRTFVGSNADKITYFQPVLDRLDFSPSPLELARPSLLVEGKGDYIILEYIQRILLNAPPPPFIVPTRGATGMDELIGLFLGWNVPFCILLDDDKEGRKAKDNYLSDWGLPQDRVFTYRDFNSQLDGAKVEQILDNSDLDLIKKHFSISNMPNKSQIRLFFSENLASNTKVALSDRAVNIVNDIIEKVSARLQP